MKSRHFFITLSSFFGLTAVIIGALSAHSLEQNFSAEAIQRFNTALDYHFYHTFALLSVGILTSLHRNKYSLLLKFSGIFFSLGTVTFSGSLYIFAITNNDFFAKLTPLGGTLLIIAWLCLLLFSIKK